jgi:hypothetical protein
MKRLVLLAMLVLGTIAVTAQVRPANAAYVPAGPAINTVVQPAAWYPCGPVGRERRYDRRVWLAREHRVYARGLCARGYGGYCRW